jgi:hypothetical protein
MSFVDPERTFSGAPGRLGVLFARVDRACGRVELLERQTPEALAAVGAALRGERPRLPAGPEPVSVEQVVELAPRHPPFRDEHAPRAASAAWRRWETPRFVVEELVARHNAAVVDEAAHPIVLAAAFVLDFLTVGPLVDGNFAVSCALLTSVMAWHRRPAALYGRLEDAVFGRREDVAAALAASQEGWALGEHSVWPWVEHVARGVGEACATVEEHVAVARELPGVSKQERVRRYVLEGTAETFRISDIREALPGVSDGTIRLALDTLKHQAAIELRSPGRDATWRRISPRELLGADS